MPWSCLQCGTANDDNMRQCGKCGAVLPFSPPTDSEIDDSPTFEVPRQGEMTAALKHGLDELKAGTLGVEPFLERLERATQNVPLVFAAILEQIEEPEEGVSDYVDGIKTSLLDCQTLFLAGLDEMSRYGEAQEPFHLRFGWLLVEKGEQEYVQITQTLARDAEGTAEFDGVQDLVGRLAESFAEGYIDRDGYLQALNRFEESARGCLDSAQQLIESALDAARDFDGDDPSPLDTASQKAALAADELGALILNLYHP